MVHVAGLWPGGTAGIAALKWVMCERGKRRCSQPCIFLWKSPPWSARTCAQEDSKLGRRGAGLGYGCG